MKAKVERAEMEAPPIHHSGYSTFLLLLPRRNDLTARFFRLLYGQKAGVIPVGIASCLVCLRTSRLRRIKRAVSYCCTIRMSLLNAKVLTRISSCFPKSDLIATSLFSFKDRERPSNDTLKQAILHKYRWRDFAPIITDERH